MHDERVDRDAARTELRKRLTDGLARARLTKTQLAAQAGLGRTTVQMALQANAVTPPSAETVAALARVLRVPVRELLDLRRTAAGEPGSVTEADQGPGKAISEWDPHDLEVHPAGLTPGRHEAAAVPERILPSYVPRNHDQVLAGTVQDVAQGRSRMVVLVGGSSTGKTRACWEAVQSLADEGWRLWHPFDPTRAEAALHDLERVLPYTVVWLNEAQHYLGDPRMGERIAAAVHSLLTHPGRGPVLILGTLWPQYADEYTALPSPGRPDLHSRVRELLAGRTLTVPEAFDQEALHKAASLSKGGDEFLAGALTRAGAGGRVTQDLAGAPELLRRYKQSTPAVRAVLEAAMDARRLGVGLDLPQTFLTDAATDYLSDHDLDQLAVDWAESAFADLARPVHGKQAPLRRSSTRPTRRPPGSPPPSPATYPEAGPVFRLADYLEQHGRTTRRRLCPPASFWHSAYTHLTNLDDINSLAKAARKRHRLQWAYYLCHRASDAGQAGALAQMSWMRDERGDYEEAEALARQAAQAGVASALTHLAKMRETRGEQAGAEALYREAASAGDDAAWVELAAMWTRVGNFDGAEALYQQAASAGSSFAHFKMAQRSWRTGDKDRAEAAFRRLADAGNPFGLLGLALLRNSAGDPNGALTLAVEATDAGLPSAISELARRREADGDFAGAEDAYRKAADAGHSAGMHGLARMRQRVGDYDGAEAAYRPAADVGNASALSGLVRLREGAGDHDGAMALAMQVADIGDPTVLTTLAEVRESAGDYNRAEALYRQAADAGGAIGRSCGKRWPHGLDPDGTPTAPWSEPGSSGR
ncbi:helix-turn-helix domain-containing protein [Streptomyces platensis]|uniref:helix-turn-helix domain-containing protein n=1 Tax=Streptomyces platensis TaxID=58346 RepID=UPI002254AAD1|nr:helix-turn-helix domain-containing protein [Streptomyces platensis]MCX4639893.1 helix-turn-helix domain-containing protein [Streptomyces platensis]